MYHKVTDQHEWGVTTVSVAAFTAQMEWLKKEGFQTISSPADVGAAEKPIILTFDDGYANCLEHAAPIMARHGFTGVVFPILNYIGKENSWDANLGGITYRHASKEQLSELVTLGWEIGAHSKSHHVPTVLAHAEDEFIACKKSLEDMFGAEVRQLSYPFGYVNEKLRQIAAEHFQFAYMANCLAKPTAQRVSRAAVYRFDSTSNLAKKINLKTLECMKLNLIHSGSKATLLYQKIIN